MINRFPVFAVLLLIFGQPIPTEAQVSRAWILWERHSHKDLITKTWLIAEAHPTYQACRYGLRQAIDSLIARNSRYGREPLGMKDVVAVRMQDGSFVLGTEVFRICLPGTIADPRRLQEPLSSREPWVLWRKTESGPPPAESWTISTAVLGYDACEQRRKSQLEKETLENQSGGPSRGPLTLRYLCLPSPLDPPELREAVKK